MSVSNVFQIERIPQSSLKQVVQKMLVLSNYRLRRTCRSMMSFLTEKMSQTVIYASKYSLVFEYETINRIRLEQILNGKRRIWTDTEDMIKRMLLPYNNFCVEQLHLKNFKSHEHVRQTEQNSVHEHEEYSFLLEFFTQVGWSCYNLTSDCTPSIAIKFSAILSAKMLEVAIADTSDCTPFLSEHFFVDYLYLKVVNNPMLEVVVRLFLANDFCRELRTSKLVEHYDFSPLPIKEGLVEEITAGFLHTTCLHKKFQFDVLKTDIEEIFLSLTGQVDECPVTVADSSGKCFYYVYIERDGGMERVVIKIEDNLEAHKRKERQRTRMRGSTFHVTYSIEAVDI